ncbi:MAG: GNAT family N-acetyltransferase [Ruminococcaceae bacterium]|jgi:GNAT superfamily N-acetyltransferase|nr:GNAT family N-acetyltransferase [Oscillospiraceae bacterium]
MNYDILSLQNHPGMMDRAARWFHEKWGIPLAAYRESMAACLTRTGPVPQWYVAVAGGRIIGGLGVIENDFHDRKDLAPNVCAVYTEPDCRCRGVAGALLRHVCADMKARGIDTLYLVTDHTGFYERYGWEFLCMTQGDGEPDLTRLYIHREA